MNFKKYFSVSTICFIIAMILILDQMRLNPENIPFEIKDIHHETFIISFAFVGIIAMYMERRKSGGKS